jgi:Ca2+-binding EF-hand superfamily protein
MIQSYYLLHLVLLSPVTRVLTLRFTVSERILARDPMDEIRRAFQLFDDDNTGKISLRNLRRVAKEIGDRLEDDEL